MFIVRSVARKSGGAPKGIAIIIYALFWFVRQIIASITRFPPKTKQKQQQHTHTHHAYARANALAAERFPNANAERSPEPRCVLCF